MLQKFKSFMAISMIYFSFAVPHFSIWWFRSFEVTKPPTRVLIFNFVDYQMKWKRGLGQRNDRNKSLLNNFSSNHQTVSLSEIYSFWNSERRLHIAHRTSHITQLIYLDNCTFLIRRKNIQSRESLKITTCIWCFVVRC